MTLGIASWAPLQLDGEVRARSWAGFVPAGPGVARLLLDTPPEELWRALVESDLLVRV